MTGSQRDLWKLPATPSELASLTDDQVMENFDHWLKVRSDPSWPDAIPFWRAEWEYRRQSSIADRAERIAKQIRWLTWVVAALTVVIAAATIFLAIQG